MAEEELEALADEARTRGIWILLDLCYEKLIYDPTPHNLPGVLARDDARPHGAVRLGVEGVRDDRLALRLGARARGSRRRLQRAAEPLDVERLLDHAEGGGRGADRPAGVRHRHARRVPRAPRSAVRLARRRAAHPAASSRPARSTCSPTSPSSSRRTASARRRSSRSRCSTSARVAVTPGEAFDAPGFLRISYATSIEDLERGARRSSASRHRLRRRSARGSGRLEVAGPG